MTAPLDLDAIEARYTNIPLSTGATLTLALVREVRRLRATLELLGRLHQPNDAEATTYCDYDGFVWPCQERRLLDGSS